MMLITQKHLQDLFLYSKRTYTYDPDVWGDTIEEAVGRVKDGYVVPQHLVKKLVSHCAEMQRAMVSMDAAIEARMTDLDERIEMLAAAKKDRLEGTKRLISPKPKETKS
jgi:hypothetical protein